ncbi:MAG: GIY-YIG nuclease family protein [Pseudomonadota bacterium]
MIYFITARDVGRVKIGFSEAPRTRFIKMQTDSPMPLVLERICDGDTADERALHQRFAGHRVNREWFTLVPEIEAHMETLPSARLNPRDKSLLQIIIAATGCGKSYACQMLSDKYAHKLTIPIALSVFFFNGMKIGPIADATDEDIAVLDKYCGRFTPAPTRAPRERSAA